MGCSTLRPYVGGLIGFSVFDNGAYPREVFVVVAVGITDDGALDGGVEPHP